MQCIRDDPDFKFVQQYFNNIESYCKGSTEYGKCQSKFDYNAASIDNIFMNIAQRCSAGPTPGPTPVPTPVPTPGPTPVSMQPFTACGITLSPISAIPCVMNDNRFGIVDDNCKIMNQTCGNDMACLKAHQLRGQTLEYIQEIGVDCTDQYAPEKKSVYPCPTDNSKKYYQDNTGHCVIFDKNNCSSVSTNTFLYASKSNCIAGIDAGGMGGGGREIPNTPGWYDDPTNQGQGEAGLPYA